MTGPVKRILLVLTLTVAVLAGTFRIAAAVDPPKWVAAVYVEAQKVVGLRWTPVPGATGYKVYKTTDRTKEFKEIASPTAPQYFDKDVEPGSEYFYYLKAVAGSELSANAETKGVLIPGQKKVVLESPEWDKITLQVTTEFGKKSFKVGLFWRAKGASLAFNIYKSLESGKQGELLTSTQDNKAIDEKVEEGKTYYYTVTALDADFVETPPSAENKIEIKAPEEEKKAAAGPVKKAARPLEVVIKPVKELANLAAGDNRDLAMPVDAAVNSDGDVYVLNGSNKTVSVFSAAGEFKFSFGKAGSGDDEMVLPMSITIDSEDNVYVCDYAKILVFDLQGKYKRTYRLPRPTDAEKIKLALSELPGNDNPDMFQPSPTDLAELKNGDLGVIDSTFSRLVIMDKKGKFVDEFGTYGFEENQLKRPGYIAVNNLGEIFISDVGNRRGVILTPDLKWKTDAGTGSKNMVGSFLGMSGIVVVDDDNFLVADPPMATLQVFSHTDGAYLYHYGGEQKLLDADSKNQRPLLGLSNPGGAAYNAKTKTLYVPQTIVSMLWIVKILE